MVRVVILLRREADRTTRTRDLPGASGAVTRFMPDPDVALNGERNCTAKVASAKLRMLVISFPRDADVEAVARKGEPRTRIWVGVLPPPFLRRSVRGTTEVDEATGQTSKRFRVSE